MSVHMDQRLPGGRNMGLFGLFDKKDKTSSKESTQKKENKDELQGDELKQNEIQE